MDDKRPKLHEGMLSKLNAVRVMIVMMIAFGYASTMPYGEMNADGIANQEALAHLGYDPSWIGISLLFLWSGFLGMRSLDNHGSSLKYLQSRSLRNLPLLVFVTLVVILILYPVFGKVSESPLQTLKTIFVYFLGTVTCIRPGEPLEGLLDHAEYMCLVQGAIWTLKWGILAHVAMAIGNQISLFKDRRIVLSLSVLSVLFYIAITSIHFYVRPVNGDIILASQLAWPFLLGVSLYQYWEKLPKNPVTNLAVTAGFFILACGLYFTSILPWSKAIIVSLTLGWIWLCVTLLKLPVHHLKFLNNWAPLTLAIYLINWPTAQILLLGPSLPLGVYMALTLSITLILAWAAHKLVSERSFRYARSQSLNRLQA